MGGRKTCQILVRLKSNSELKNFPSAGEQRVLSTDNPKFYDSIRATEYAGGEGYTITCNGAGPLYQVESNDQRAIFDF
jgi:hypothetical protein